jgi:hypothetical protein
LGSGRRLWSVRPTLSSSFLTKLSANWTPTTVDGKREIVKQLAPLVFRIAEPVTRAHFVRKLSIGINVAESSIWDIINRLGRPKTGVRVPDTANRKTKQEILEDQVLGLSLLLKDHVYLADLDLALPTDADKKELLKFAAETDTKQQDLDPKIELPRAANELMKLILHRKMEQLGKDLVVAEKAKDKSLLQKLSTEFTKLSQQMKGLN